MRGAEGQPQKLGGKCGERNNQKRGTMSLKKQEHRKRNKRSWPVFNTVLSNSRLLQGTESITGARFQGIVRS